MDCDTYREALSARMDGEPEPVPADQVDAHVAECGSCRRWQQDAAVVTRTLRVRPAVEVPDFTAAVLDAAPAVPRRPLAARTMLGVVAVGQIAVAVSHLFASDGHVGIHHLNESSAWNLAVGLGLFWAALRPRAASGMLPIVAAFVAVLIPLSVNDLLSEAASVGREASHSIIVVGLVLLFVVHRGERRRPDDRMPTSQVPGPGSVDAHDVTAEQPRAGALKRRTRLRPVSRRSVA